MPLNLGSSAVSLYLGSQSVNAYLGGTLVTPPAGLTLYFNGAVDNDWSTLGNWWLDDGHTVAASALPTAADSAIASINFISSNSGSEPTVANLTIEGVFAGGGMALSVTGMATFNSGAVNEFELTGNATFNGSENTGTVTGNATFDISSTNTATGTVTGNATFDGGFNQGTVNGDASFINGGQNASNVGGTATFDESSCNDGFFGFAGTFVPDPPPSC
jgi:hypothetical protein